MPSLKAILNTLADHFGETRKIHRLQESATAPPAFLYWEEGRLQTFTLPAKDAAREHRFDYAADFVDFLITMHNADPGAVAGPCFVDATGALCQLNYDKPAEIANAAAPLICPADLFHRVTACSPFTATLNLDPSTAWERLKTLEAGVTQKELWRLLVSTYRDMVPPAHLLEISALDLSKREDATLTLDRLGGSEKRIASTVRLTYRRREDNSESSAELSTLWRFNLPRFKNWPQRYPLDAALEFDTERNLFRFLPVEPEAVTEAALLTVADELRRRITDRDIAGHAVTLSEAFPVFRGTA